MSAAQLSALSVLMGGPRTLGELAALEQVQPPTMSRLVRELVGAGLVTRTRDADDARVVWVRWTSEGQAVLMRGRELRVLTLARQIEALAGRGAGDTGGGAGHPGPAARCPVI